MGTAVTRNALHKRTHPGLDEPDCFGCRAAHIQFAQPFSPHTVRDREFSADQDAYKRLRADGLQPQSPQGAAEVERHQLEQIEIDAKMKLPEPVKEQMKEIQAGVKAQQTSAERAW
jgi:hypothetical protein